jgi:tetratricopeptide (TPR) repeat protein
MPKKKLNVKLLFWTVAPLLVFGTAAHLVHAAMMKRHARHFLAEALRSERASQRGRAETYLNRYLVFVPQDVDALARYGLALDRSADTPNKIWQVLSIFEQVLSRDPTRQVIRRRLAERALELGLYADARGHLETLLERSPRRARLYELYGECLEALGENPAAAAAYNLAIRYAPQRTRSYLRLADLLRYRLDQSDQAARTLDALVQANPASALAHVARARFHQEFGSLSQAARDITRARQLAPAAAAVLKASAEIAALRGRVRAARRYWQRGLKHHPRRSELVLGLASLELDAGHPGRALACLRRGLEKLPDHPELLRTLAEVYLRKGDLAAVSRLARGLAKKKRRLWPLGDYLRGRARMHQGRWVAAIRTLERVTRAEGTPPDLAARSYLSLGECFEQTGEGDLRLSACRRAVALTPGWVFAHLKLGLALLADEQVDEAVDEFRLVTRQPRPPAAVWTLLARALIRRNQGLLKSQQDWGEVEEVLGQASRVAGGGPRTGGRRGGSPPEPLPSAELVVLQAEVFQGRKHPELARAALTEAGRRQPNQFLLWNALAALEARQGNRTAALRVLRTAGHRFGDCLELRQAWLDFLARFGGRGGVGRATPNADPFLRELEGNLHKYSRTDRLALLGKLAQTHYRLGNNSQARRLAGRLVEEDPENLPARVLLLDLALEAGGDGPIRRAVVGLRWLERRGGPTSARRGGGTWGPYGEAARLVARVRAGHSKNVARARQLLQGLTRTRAGWPRVYLLSARLHDWEGDPSSALKDYLRAIDLGERRQEVVARAVQLLVTRERFLEADRLIRKFAVRQPLDRPFHRVAVGVALKARHFDRALDLVRRAVNPGSRDYRDHLWLAEVLAAAERPAEAEEEFARALRLGQRLPDTWVALVSYLARSGQTREARDALPAMTARLRPDARPLALAQCYEALGDWDRAGEQYQAALGRKPNDPVVLQRAARFYLHSEQPRRAEPPLWRLLDRTVLVSPPTRHWARRLLALVLARQGSSQVRLALSLLDANRAEEPQTPADRRARLLVLANRPGQRGRMLALLETSARREPLSPAEKFALVQLYVAEDDWTRAGALMVALQSADRPNPAYLVFYIRSLLLRDRTAEAQRWVARLEALEPESPRTLRLKQMIGIRD